MGVSKGGAFVPDSRTPKSHCKDAIEGRGRILYKEIMGDNKIMGKLNFLDFRIDLVDKRMSLL